MENRLYLALSLTVFPLCAARGAAPSQNPDAEPAGIYAAADAAFVDALRSVQQLKECRKLLGRMERDIAEKEAALKAEFGGRIPFELSSVLENKRKRTSKQHAACYANEEAPTPLFERAIGLLRAIEPTSLPGIAVRQKKLSKAMLSFNQMVAPPKKEPRPAP